MDRPTEPTLPSEPGVLRTPVLPARYRDLGRLGRGAMGEVRRVHDGHLRREVAMKILRGDALVDETSRERFFAEARLTAGLQHPAIVAVYDLGTLPDGRVWFTMPEVHGQTLGSHIRAVHMASDKQAWRATQEGASLRALLNAVADAAAAAAHAHQAGVVHRDLKPDNIMIGAHRQVLVLDWGLALARGIDTRSGAVVGTPGFMPPEQAASGAQGSAADVYALGSILYTVLSGQSPYTGRPPLSLAVLSGPPTSLAQLLKDRPPIPDGLVELCAAAMAREAGDRPHAGDLAGRLRAILDGSAALAQATTLVHQADAQLARPDRLRARAAEARQRAAQLLAPVEPTDPVDRKREGWVLEERAAALENEALAAELLYEDTLRRALSVVPAHPPARTRLAQHHRARLVAAERSGDRAALRHEALLRSYDDGTHAAWLGGMGTLTLHTDPPGARVLCARLTTRDRRRIPDQPEDLGSTPLDRRPLAQGDYVLELQHPDHPTVRYPVSIGRGAHWDGVPPGRSAPHAIQLCAPAPGSVVVAAGWFPAGGDPNAPDPHPARRVWLDGFAIQEHPVTTADYLAFLDDLAATGRTDEAEARAPREKVGATASERPLMLPRSDGHVLATDTAGNRWGKDWPVVLVDWHDARAYARWLRIRTGLPWRLPHDLEWEKAARGVEGRMLPWGDFLDPTWCRMADSHTGVFSQGSVHDFPLDVSVYGVRGMGGNTRDWCANAYERLGVVADRLPDAVATEAGHRMVRGGSFSSSVTFCSSAARFAGPPTQRLSSLGFRLVYTLAN